MCQTCENMAREALERLHPRTRSWIEKGIETRVQQELQYRLDDAREDGWGDGRADLRQVYATTMEKLDDAMEALEKITDDTSSLAGELRDAGRDAIAAWRKLPEELKP